MNSINTLQSYLILFIYAGKNRLFKQNYALNIANEILTFRDKKTTKRNWTRPLTWLDDSVSNGTELKLTTTTTTKTTTTPRIRFELSLSICRLFIWKQCAAAP